MNNKKSGHTQCEGSCKECEWHRICPHDPATNDTSGKEYQYEPKDNTNKQENSNE